MFFYFLLYYFLFVCIYSKTKIFSSHLGKNRHDNFALDVLSKK